MEAWRARPFTTRVSTRLVAIALVPLLGLGVMVRAEAQDRWRLADDAEHLKAQVEQVSTILPVGLLISREVFLVGAYSVGAERGLSPTVVDSLLGFDVAASLRSIRSNMERRLDRLPPGDPMIRYRNELKAIHRASAGGSMTDADAAARLVEVTAAVNAAAFDAFRDLENQSLGDAGASRADRAVNVLRAANDAASAVFDEVSILVPLVVTRHEPELSSALDRLRSALAQGTVAERALDSSAIGAVADEWRRLEADPDARVNSAEIVAISRADLDSLPRLDPSQLAGLFGRSMDRLSAYYRLVDRAAADAAASAQRAREAAMGRLRTMLLVIGLLFTVTLLITVLIARSIALPLRRLAAGAADVRAGRLDVLLPRRGPREFTALTDTLHEVVGNLRLVEAHVGALASGKLDHPALAERVPGRLGKLLHESMSRLSRSMVEQEQLAERLQHEATHDALTGLPNRSAAARHLQSLLAVAAEGRTPLALLYVDLDGFKQVNDAYGHETGDTVLMIAATRLVRAVRGGDFVGRIGGDEFLVVTSGLADGFELNALGERLIAEVSAPITVGSVTIRVGASVGVAFSGDGSADADALLRDADLAGYEAKAAGRGRVEMFDEELRAELRRADELDRALRQALADDALELHYQPVFDALDGRPVGVEALLRWNSGELGPVSPGEFIPVAEASDLIVDVDRWVLDCACAHLAAWRDDPMLGSIPVAVNLSGRHLLNLTCVDDVRAALERHGVSPHRLVVEITETVLLVDVALIAEHLSALRATGVRVAIDDFGTGFTSLTHLGALPADVLKIDMSLVKAASFAPQTEVVALLVGTAHALGLAVTAEGIETPEQHACMRSLGCDALQGFLLAAPGPIGDVRALMQVADSAAGARL